MRNQRAGLSIRLGYRSMDKKAKKRIEVLQPKLQKLRMQLAGAKKQMDDAAEVKRLESEIAATEKELAELRHS
jgi:peptidoglycan hydrolase CwlO-like protein